MKLDDKTFAFYNLQRVDYEDYLLARLYDKPTYVRINSEMTGRGGYIEQDGVCRYDDMFDGFSFFILVPDYNSYINSDLWRARREKYFKTHKKQCYFCGASANIQLHHKTYRNLGSEDDDDLEPVCANCHKAIHEFAKSLEYLKQSIEKGTKSLKHDYNEKARLEIQQRIHSFMERAMPRIQAALSGFPPVIGGHKPHIAAVLRDTLGFDIPSQILIKHLKSK